MRPGISERLARNAFLEKGQPPSRPEPPVRRRVCRYQMLCASGGQFHGRMGTNQKGPIDRLRRNIRERRCDVTYVYDNEHQKTGVLVLSNYPLKRDDLVGAYLRRSVTNKMLREDLYG